MSGTRFSTAYIGSFNDPVLGRKVVVPDHKLYFVPVPTLQEAPLLSRHIERPSDLWRNRRLCGAVDLGNQRHREPDHP